MLFPVTFGAGQGQMGAASPGARWTPQLRMLLVALSMLWDPSPAAGTPKVTHSLSAQGLSTKVPNCADARWGNVKEYRQSFPEMVAYSSSLFSY